MRYRSNGYSVPVAYAHHDFQVFVYAHVDMIGCGLEVIALHKRPYNKAEMIYDPIHFLPLRDRKASALDQAAPLQGWSLPDAFAMLHRLLVLASIIPLPSRYGSRSWGPANRRGT
ncbi:Mu transposase domain-containing protein [Pararhodobacter oceanensis]|uniref:Mu transposase domain-containing protein n=1 Tax=Pararhodobacter oceanensis TaxID=2172121 RepID=UPI002678D89F